MIKKNISQLISDFSTHNTNNDAIDIMGPDLYYIYYSEQAIPISIPSNLSRMKNAIMMTELEQIKDSVFPPSTPLSMESLLQTQSEKEAQIIIDEIIIEMHDNNNDRQYSTEDIINVLEEISIVHGGRFKSYVEVYLNAQKKTDKYEQIKYIKDYVNAVLNFVQTKNIQLPNEFLKEPIDYKAAISYLGELISDDNLYNDCFKIAFKEKLIDLFKRVVNALNSFESDDAKLQYIQKCSDILHPIVNHLLVRSIQNMSNEYRRPLIEAIKPSIEPDSKPEYIIRFVESLFIEGNDHEINLGLKLLKETIQTITSNNEIALYHLFGVITREYDTKFLDLLRVNNDHMVLDTISFLPYNTEKPLTESNIDQIIDIINKNIAHPTLKIRALNVIIPLCNQDQINEIEKISKGIQSSYDICYLNEAMKKWKIDHLKKNQSGNLTFQQMIEEQSGDIIPNDLKQNQSGNLTFQQMIECQQQSLTQSFQDK